MQIEAAMPTLPALFAYAMPQVLRHTAEGAEEGIKAWYRKLPENWFDSRKAEFPDGTAKHGGPRTFMRALTRYWKAEDVSEKGFTLQFRHDREDGSPWGLRLQEYGDTITPKRKRALTLPVTAEARGMSATRFSETVHKLFPVGTQNPQGNKLGTLVWEDAGGELHAAYVLRKSSTIKPLIQRRRHHGIPTPYQLGNLVRPYFRDAVEFALNQP